ncbi:MAG: hypothetical protein ACRDL4_00430 [Thermoleophilaceae bacterium]
MRPASPRPLGVGPTWDSHFFLGADGNGRDVMVRLLYAGRSSLLIAFSAALLASLAAVCWAWWRGIAAGGSTR